MSKHGWTYKKLGEVASYINGFAFKPETWSERGIPIIRIQNLNNEEAPFNFYDGELDEKFIVRDDDLLISWSASLGVYIWKRGLAYLNQHIFKVRFDKGNINKYYLAYSVESKLAEMSKNTHGSTMRHIVKKDFDNIKIPVPSMAEQEAIVAELDEINEAIAETQQQIADLDTLAQSTFYDMFGDPVTNPKGWEVKIMGEVGELQRGAGLSKKDLIENGFPCILYGQIHTRFGAYTKNHIACIPQDLVKTAKIAHYGDILMAITSEDVEGSCKSVAWLGDYEIAVGSDAAIFRHTLNPIYVSYYTQTTAFYAEKAKYAKGFKVTHISTKEIAKIPITVPPLTLQQEFASRVEAIEAAKAELNAQIAEMQTLLASRMDYYFD